MGFWDGSGISWTTCKQSAPRSRQITTRTPHQSLNFYRPDALPDAQLTVSKHRMQWLINTQPINGAFPGLPRWSRTRKVKPIWISLKQETVSGSGISWAICKSAPCSRQPCQHPTTQFFTGWMPFLSPNQQRQSTEGKSTKWLINCLLIMPICKWTLRDMMEQSSRCFR